MSKVLDQQYADAKGTIIKKPGIGILFAAGTTVPAAATAGYATGCLFLHTDGTATTALYVNTGSETSSLFVIAHAAAPGTALTTQLTTVTPADAAGTPDYAIQAVINSSAYGFASAQELITFIYVVQNLQTRVAELEAVLETAGILTAN